MTARPRVLVADDDPALLDAIGSAFEEWGAEVVRAADGAALIGHMAEGPFALVVTDISMPWMSGLQVMHSARYVGLSTPIILMTGLDDETIPARVAALGENVLLLRKPFELGDLEEAVGRLLAWPPAD